MKLEEKGVKEKIKKGKQLQKKQVAHLRLSAAAVTSSVSSPEMTTARGPDRCPAASIAACFAGPASPSSHTWISISYSKFSNLLYLYLYLYLYYVYVYVYVYAGSQDTAI